MQCAATAAAAVGTATGTRAWLGVMAFAWLTPSRKRAATALLLGAGVLASGLGFNGAT